MSNNLINTRDIIHHAILKYIQRKEIVVFALMNRDSNYCIDYTMHSKLTQSMNSRDHHLFERIAGIHNKLIQFYDCNLVTDSP